MAHNRNRTSAGRAAAATPPIAVTPAIARQTTQQVNFQRWCNDFCNNADGTSVVSGINNLGPINGFQDLIVAAGNGSPQVILAAEQILHLIEGWRYASAAVSAYLTHGKGTATHLAYYAELRAAMSLFAGSGMRVRQKEYFYLNAAGARVDVRSHPTHSAVWEIWNLWTRRSDAKGIFLDRIKLCPNVSLSAVIRTLQFVNPTATLQGWGLDLLQVSDDHEARNRASYEAYWVDTPLTQMASSDVDIIRNLWSLFFSDGSSLAFDQEFVRHCVETALPGLVTLNHTLTPDQHRAAIAKQLANDTGVPEDFILRRLIGSTAAITPFVLASAPNSETENVLCRSFFLLRLALLSLKGSLAVTTNLAAKEWIKNWLSHAGIWSPTDGIDLADLEEDYRISVSDISSALPLPSALWTGNNLIHAARLTRPHACIAWGLVA